MKQNILAWFKKKFFIFPMLLLLPLFFQSCAGSESLVLVVDSAGNPVPGIVVELLTIDDQGQALEVVASQITKEDGVATIGFSQRKASALVLRVMLSGSPQRAFITDDVVSGSGIGTHTRLDPIAEALVSAVVYVTETAGGRTLGDFSIEELRAIIEKARNGSLVRFRINRAPASRMSLARAAI